MNVILNKIKFIYICNIINMVDKTNILPALQARLGVDWTPVEKEAEKELGKIIYSTTDIDLENLSEDLNDSADDALFENYMVKRNDFIYIKEIGNPNTTPPTEILSNIKKKIKKARKEEMRREEMTKKIIIDRMGATDDAIGGSKSKYKKHKKKSKKRKSNRKSRKSKRRKTRRKKR